MASAKVLGTHTRKELAQIARDQQVAGWHAMKKAELIQALASSAPNSSLKAPSARSRALRAEEADAPRLALRRSDQPRPPIEKAQVEEKPPASVRRRPVRLTANASAEENDRLTAKVQGPYWIYATWALTARILARAEASLGSDWHAAAPMLRLYELDANDEKCPSKCCVAKIPLGNPVDHWYLPIPDPRRTYELQLGYETPQGHFFLLARSMAVHVPMPGTPQARKYDAARQEADAAERSPRPGKRMPFRGAAAYRAFAEPVTFQVEAELVILGQAAAHARVSCQEEEILADAQGQFEVRMTLTEGRHVIPLMAVTPDGQASQLILLAVERNTKTLEPKSLSEGDDA